MHPRSMHPSTRLRNKQTNKQAENPEKHQSNLVTQPRNFINIQPARLSHCCCCIPLLRLGNGAFDDGHSGDINTVGVAVEER